MKHLHGHFASQYNDQRGNKYAVHGNFTSLPANEGEQGRDVDMIYVKFHKIEEAESDFINKPEDGEIYLTLINLKWTPGHFRNQQFVPSLTAFNSWLQVIVLKKNPGMARECLPAASSFPKTIEQEPMNATQPQEKQSVFVQEE